MKKFLSLLLLGCASLPAAVIGTVDNWAETMNGGTITVFYDGGGSETVQLADGPGYVDAYADLANRFRFSLQGDTRANLWNLTNLHTLAITAFEIDLTGSFGNAVFDDNNANKAPGSDLGTFLHPRGLINYPAPAETTGVSVTYSLPYLADGGANMYFKVRGDFNVNGNLAAGDLFEFEADTDVTSAVPEPSTWMAGILISVGLIGRRKRRS